MIVYSSSHNARGLRTIELALELREDQGNSLGGTSGGGHNVQSCCTLQCTTDRPSI